MSEPTPIATESAPPPRERSIACSSPRAADVRQTAIPVCSFVAEMHSDSALPRLRCTTCMQAQAVRNRGARAAQMGRYSRARSRHRCPTRTGPLGAVLHTPRAIAVALCLCLVPGSRGPAVVAPAPRTGGEHRCGPLMATDGGESENARARGATTVTCSEYPGRDRGGSARPPLRDRRGHDRSTIAPGSANPSCYPAISHLLPEIRLTIPIGYLVRLSAITPRPVVPR